MRVQGQEPEANGCFHWLCFKTWYPFSTMRSVILLSLLLGFIFITIAVVQFLIYHNSYEQRVAYSTEGKCSGSSSANRCQVQISIDQDLQPPILLMYVIEGAYINHRKYINSINENQLMGKTIDMSTAKTTCTPFVTNGDLGVNSSFGGSPLVSSNIGYPCGFKPFLVFNDTYSLFDSSGNKIAIDETKLDPQYSSIFSSPQGSEQDQWINVVNEHFDVWTKDQAMIGKYKLWGRINKALPKGNYNLVANNNYQINKLRLKKSVELVVPTKLGGPLYFFPISFLIMGLICVGYVVFLKSEMADYDAVVSSN